MAYRIVLRHAVAEGIARLPIDLQRHLIRVLAGLRTVPRPEDAYAPPELKDCFVLYIRGKRFSYQVDDAKATVDVFRMIPAEGVDPDETGEVVELLDDAELYDPAEQMRRISRAVSARKRVVD